MEDYSLLSRVFSRSVLLDCVDRGQNDVYSTAAFKFIPNPEENSNAINFEQLYKLLQKKYRNEYFYKNTLLNKLLLGVHSPRTTTALAEFPTAKAKADFILINGKAVVYEVKTELDNTARLRNQLENYFKVFDHATIVTGESHVGYLVSEYGQSPVGIYQIAKSGRIKHLKEPDLNTELLDSSAVFSTLRKGEYESILLKFYDALPKKRPVEYYSTCHDWFCRLNISDIYPEYLACLKKRHVVESLSGFSSIPQSIRYLSYFCDFNNRKTRKLRAFVDRRFAK